MKRWAGVLALWVAGAAWGQDVEVRMQDMQFQPAQVHIRVGDNVRWLNTEKRGYHTVWFQGEGLDESEPLFPGEAWQRSFDLPGRYEYLCGPHPDMRGVVIVE